MAKTSAAAYERHKAAMAQRVREQSAAARDIGDIPPVVDHTRKARGRASLRAFCEEYFADRFALEWSDDHLAVIDALEKAITTGGLFALAMPRGSGKTSLCEVAAIWAAVYAWHHFLMLIGSAESHAGQMLSSIKAELSTNDALAEDFPEICYPIRRLEGETRRALGQTHHGERTKIGWLADKLILPSIPGSKASGAVIRVAGITGNIRGAKHDLGDGRSVRPSLAIIDDPQTDESARSPSQVENRKKTIDGAILGLAGPGQQIAAVMPCTVIQRGDLADQLLDRETNPLWQGRRTRMVYDWPTDGALWEKYREIREDEFRDGGNGDLSTEFYRKNRAAMDAGARVAWPARKLPGELSALQHAMNIRFRVGEHAFAAEYDNDPIDDDESTRTILTEEEVAAKLSGLPRGVVPPNVDVITVGIDVQAKLLPYTVIGWAADFTGYVLDYGTWPDQGRRYFTLRDAQVTLKRKTPGAGLEGAIFNGLTQLTNEIIGKEYVRQDGTILRVDRCLVDANWGESTDVVYQFCRQSPHANVLTPSHGKHVGATSIPWHTVQKQRGEKRGLHWRQPPSRGRGVRYTLVDTNYWKSFVHARLSAAIGDRGSLSLFGKKASTHKLWADWLCAEWPTTVEAKGRKVDEWKTRPNRPDNHALDVTVLAAVAASMSGVNLEGTSPAKAPKRPRGRRKMSDLQNRKAT